MVVVDLKQKRNVHPENPGIVGQVSHAIDDSQDREVARDQNTDKHGEQKDIFDGAKTSHTPICAIGNKFEGIGN